MLCSSTLAPTPEGKQVAAWGGYNAGAPFIPVQRQTGSELTYMGANLQHFAAASNARGECLPCRGLRHAASATSPDVPSSAVLGPVFPYENRPGSVFALVHAPSTLVALRKYQLFCSNIHP